MSRLEDFGGVLSTPCIKCIKMNLSVTQCIFKRTIHVDNILCETLHEAYTPQVMADSFN